ncbi:MAG: S41 family peptidase [Sphingosinicella sp.]
MRKLMLSVAALAMATAAGAIGQPTAMTPQAPQAPAEDEASRAEVVENLARTLEEVFVFPDIASRYAQALRTKAAAGGYRNLGPRFAETLEADLQAVHRDRHLRIGAAAQMATPGRRMVRAPQPGAGASPAPAPTAAPAPASPSDGTPRRVMRMPDPASAIGRSGWVADGVAYLELGLFPGNPETLERLARLLDEFASARTLILDIRNHQGGGLAEMDVIFSRLFARETALVTMDTRLAVAQRLGEAIPDSVYLRRESGPEGINRRVHYAVPGATPSPLRNARVFLLTSARSGSAAEHFALALKRTGRATLIGETTTGAGHYGMPRQIGHGYAAFIPFGRTFNPDTGQGWEGTGVAPNVSVAAEQALDEALRRAGIDPAQARTLASLH